MLELLLIGGSESESRQEIEIAGRELFSSNLRTCS